MKALDPLELPLTGRALIEASAGTGKTYTITTLVLRLLVESRLELSEILIVTYTRAATAELKARVRSRVESLRDALAGATSEDPVLRAMVRIARDRGSLDDDLDRVERALGASDDAAIFTIHGFCQRVLTDFAFEADAPFDLSLFAQSEALVAEVAHDYWTRATHALDPAAYGRLRRVGPEGIAALIARTAHGEMPEILPSEAPAPADEAAWFAARAELLEAWPRGRTGLVDAILAKKLGYGVNRLESYLGRLEQWLTDPEARPPLGDKLRNDLDQLTTKLQDKARAPGKEPPDHPLLPLLARLDEADAALARCLSFAHAERLRDGLLYARTELSRRTEQQGGATFDQLLSRTADALAGPRGTQLSSAIQARYVAALIDEFQDTDPLQYRIFDAALGSRTLLLIGDPKQAIYGFRGADVFAYLRAREAVGDGVYTMKTNYRSDPGVLAGLNHLYGTCADAFGIEAIRYEPVDARPDAAPALPESVAPVELLWTETRANKGERTADIAARVASDIVRTLRAEHPLRGEGGTRPLGAGDVAVLCRTNQQARLVQQMLSTRQVPSVLSGDDSVFDSQDAADLERVLAALADPHDARAVRSALSCQYVGLTAEELDALDTELHAGEQHYGRLLGLHRTWLERGFIRALREFTRTYHVDERLLARPDGARRWTNLQHLLELLQDASAHQRLGPAGLLRFLRTMRSDVARRGELLGESTQIRLESHRDAVTLTTVHRSKGLEYPLVYVPFSWLDRGPALDQKAHPLIHRAENAGRATLDLGSDDLPTHQQRAVEEAQSESLRLLYVALTRARHAVRVVCHPVSTKTGLYGFSRLLGADGSPPDLEQLARLVEESHGRLALRTLAEADDTVLPTRPSVATAARARSRKQRPPDPEQIASFSSLSHARSGGPAPRDSGVDHDEVPALTTATSARAPDSTWHLFPRGPSEGTLVHSVLEQTPPDASRDALAEAAARLLPSRGLSAALAEPLAAGLHDALATPLSDTGLTLAGVPQKARVAEMEFMFRVAPSAPLDGRALAQVLRTHSAPAPHPSYADALAELPMREVQGYLRGFIDLVFLHEERAYVVDYKSNHLGDHRDDYAPEALREAMARHHYYLQYLLYSVAVHRYLRRRVPSYAPARHFGGVYYLFLRGMAPATGAARGVYFDRPSDALLHDLDAALGHDPREAG